MFRPVLEPYTQRLFFSPHRRRAVRVVNHRALFVGGSNEQPGSVEAVQAPDGQVLRLVNAEGSLWTRQVRLRRPYSVVAQQRIESTPAWVAVSDDGDALVFSYWLDYQRHTIERYEVRSWPAFELIGRGTAPLPPSQFGRFRPSDEAIVLVSPDGKSFALAPC